MDWVWLLKVSSTGKKNALYLLTTMLMGGGGGGGWNVWVHKNTSGVSEVNFVAAESNTVEVNVSLQ